MDALSEPVMSMSCFSREQGLQTTPYHHLKSCRETNDLSELEIVFRVS